MEIIKNNPATFSLIILIIILIPISILLYQPTKESEPTEKQVVEEKTDIYINKFEGELIKDSQRGSCYVYDNGNISFVGASSDKNGIVEGADIDTFRRIQSQLEYSSYPCYAKDKEHVYNGRNIIRGVDRESFEIVDHSQHYSKDKNYVYYKDRIVKEANPNTIHNLVTEKVAFSNYFADEKYIYIAGKRYKAIHEEDIDNVIAKSMAAVDGEVYCGDNLIPNADAESFIALERSWGKDKNKVYRCTLEEDYDPETFEVIEYSYWKDKNGVYTDDICNTREHSTKEIKIEGADPDTFESLHKIIAKDKNNVYFGGPCAIEVIEDADPETFEYLADEYSKDKNHIFFRSKILEEADYDSFEIQLVNETYQTYKAFDKNHIYIDGEVHER